MSKSDDQRIAALARKNAAKAAQPKPKPKRHQFDDTLPPEVEESTENRDFFSQMKKREF